MQSDVRACGGICERDRKRSRERLETTDHRSNSPHRSISGLTHIPSLSRKLSIVGSKYFVSYFTDLAHGMGYGLSDVH